MAKQGGLGARLLTGGYDISGDVQAIDTISGNKALLDVTDITQSAHSRITGLRDGSMAFTLFFDAANAHPVLKTLPSADTQVMALLPTLAIGAPAACLNAKQVNYDPTRGADGALTLKTDAQGNSFGLEWAVTLTAGLRTDTAATNGTSLDNAASTAFGAQAYMQCTAFTGTDVTVKVQDSADNSSWADVTGLTFTQITAAPASQRLATANNATIRRYLRAVTVTSGGVTSVTFAVAINRNGIAGQVF